MVHLGNNIAKLRGFRRLPQKEVAGKLHLSQQEYSKLEAKAEIDDDLLERIAAIFDFPIELIKSMDTNGHVENVYQQEGNKGHVFNYELSPTEKIIELYERMLKEKDELIELYKSQLKTL